MQILSQENYNEIEFISFTLNCKIIKYFTKVPLVVVLQKNKEVKL